MTGHFHASVVTAENEAETLLRGTRHRGVGPNRLGDTSCGEFNVLGPDEPAFFNVPRNDSGTQCPKELQ
jgi:hypothetical protein